jgi:hypothetical protein
MSHMEAVQREWVLGNLSSAIEKAEGQWKQIFKLKVESWQQIQCSKYIFLPVCFILTT